MTGTVLADSLALAVPLQMMKLRGESPGRRRLIARRAAMIVGCQGDTFHSVSGRHSPRRFGDGQEQEQRHRDRTGSSGRRCYDPRCWCCRGGQPDYSPGEIFTELARGLACAALLPGGVEFAGRHWCAAPHDGCPVVAEPEREQVDRVRVMAEFRALLDELEELCG